MGDIRLSGADAMLLSWDKGYTLSTDKDKDKDKRKARVNFGSVELLDGAHFSQSKNALDSGDSMTIGKGAKMDVAGLSTWQTVTLKAADAQIRLMDEGTAHDRRPEGLLHRRGHSQEAHRPHASGLQRDRHRHGGALGHDPQGDPGALSRPAVSRLQLRLLHPKGQRRIRGRPRDRSLSVSGRTGLCGRHVSGCVRRVHEVHLSYVPDDDGALFERWADRHPESESGSVDETSAD